MSVTHDWNLMNIILVGAGGHAKAVADVIRYEKRYRISGLIDSFKKPGTVCFNYKVLGDEKKLPDVCSNLNISRIFIAIGDNFQRQSMAQRIEKSVPGIEFVTIVHPSAVIGSNVCIGDGSVIMPGVTVVSGSSIADGCILNTSSSLDHDGKMDDWSSIGPGVVIGGNVHVGERSAICLGARINHQIDIGRDSVIGAGAVVTKNIPDNVVAYGIPCSVIQYRQAYEAYL